MTLKDHWDFETAIKVLQHPTVDAKLWAEAVEWLLRYGPPAIQKLLLDASQLATEAQFPELRPASYTEDGQPVYDTEALAMALGISEEEVRRIIARKNLPGEASEVFQQAGKTIH